jgi:hypothetical protein
MAEVLFSFGVKNNNYLFTQSGHHHLIETGLVPVMI